MLRRRSALLLGSYGQANLGDDLLLLNFLGLLAKEGFETVIVSCNDRSLLPQLVEHPGMEVRFFNPYATSPRELTRVLRSVDAVYYGGGSTIKELPRSTGRHPLAVLARIAGFNVAARALRRPIYNLQIGVGPLDTRTGRVLAVASLAASAETTVRDPESYRLASSLNVLRRPLRLGADGVFLGFTDPYFSPPKPGARPRVGINALWDVRGNRSKYLAALADFAAAESDHADIVLLPMQWACNPHNDVRVLEDCIAPRVDPTRLELVRKVSPDEAATHMGSLELMVATRLHAMILATVMGVPFLAIEYDPKCTSFLDQICYRHRVHLEDVTTSRLHETASRLRAERDSVIDLLSEANDRLRSRAAMPR